MAVSGGSTSFTDLSYTGTLTGGTGVVNIGAGQVYKDASGNLMLGTTSSTALSTGQLQLGTTSASGSAIQMLSSATGTSGVYFGDGTTGDARYRGAIEYDNAGDSLRFYSTSAERARIDSSGNLLCLRGLVVGGSGTIDGKFAIATAALSAGAGTYPLKWNSTTGAVTYDTSSRLVKTGIVDSPYGLAEALQIKARQYTRVDSGQTEIGLIADEVVEILPEFVPMVLKSVLTGNEEDIELVAGGVSYDKLTAVLFKAIQEQQALITALTTRITALESK
jgi:hypothetical protein